MAKKSVVLLPETENILAIVYSMAVSNTDDHFRIYRFILSEGGI